MIQTRRTGAGFPSAPRPCSPHGLARADDSVEGAFGGVAGADLGREAGRVGRDGDLIGAAVRRRGRARRRASKELSGAVALGRPVRGRVAVGRVRDPLAVLLVVATWGSNDRDARELHAVASGCARVAVVAGILCEHDSDDDRSEHEQCEEQRHDRDAATGAGGPRRARRLRRRLRLDDHRRLAAVLRLEVCKACLQLAADLVHRGRPVGRQLREAAPDERREAERRVGPRCRDVRHRVVHVLHRDREEAVARVGHLTREQLVEDDAE